MKNPTRYAKNDLLFDDDCLIWRMLWLSVGQVGNTKTCTKCKHINNEIYKNHCLFNAKYTRNTI